MMSIIRKQMSLFWLLLLIGGLTTLLPLQENQRAVAQEPVTADVSASQQALTTLQDLNNAFVHIAAQVKPAVVTVSTERDITRGRRPGSPFAGDPFFDFFFGPRNRQQTPEQHYRQYGLGSGVIVSADGYILTNNHVIENADSIIVRTMDGRRFPATVVGTDPKTDVAVLQIGGDNLAYIEVGDSDSLRVGEIVLAVGSPMSENLAYTVTQGIVSAKGRSNVGLADYEDFIQTDAAINPGNSGGPMVNLNGELVGINTAIASATGGFQGIGFAVPVNMVMGVMNSLISEGRVVRGYLGVAIQDVNESIANAMNLEEPRGALIGDVESGTPAARAGLQAGDVIVEVDGRQIANSGQLRSQIASTKPGTTVDLTILRDGKRQDVNVVLGELPSETAQGPASSGLRQQIGFTVQTLTRDLADQYNIDRQMTGVVVTSIDQSSAAYRTGLREGDVIRSVNRVAVDDASSFEEVINQIPDNEAVLLRIYRDGANYFLAFNK